ncbi:MAG: DUF1080 domain-containing protein [Candidatus Nitrosopolaris sp.]
MLTAECLIFLVLVSSITSAFLTPHVINMIFPHNSIGSLYLKSKHSYNTNNSMTTLSSFVPSAYLFSSTNDSERMKRIDNSMNVHDKLYDNFEGSTYTLSDGQISPNGKWKAAYTGFGSMGVCCATPGITNNFFFEQPKASVYHNDTRASLATTTKAFSDFQMTLDMKTVMQLRQNTAPNPWETAWIFWHWTDNFHYYALVLKTNGFQIEKKDNNNHNDLAEIYLIDVSHPKVKLGQWQTITIRHEDSNSGTPHIQVWVDGVKAADFVDDQIPNSYKMSSGYLGLYNEDSNVNFDNVSLNVIH